MGPGTQPKNHFHNHEFHMNKSFDFCWNITLHLARNISVRQKDLLNIVNLMSPEPYSIKAM